MSDIRAIWPAGGNVIWKEFGGSICSLFTFAQDHCVICLQAQLVQSQQWAWLGQALPPPLDGLIIGTLAPRQRCKYFLGFAVFVQGKVKAIKRHKGLALSIAIDPDFGWRAVLPIPQRSAAFFLASEPPTFG